MEQSIYQIIREAVTEEGVLPGDFILPQEEIGSIRWAPGAMDGVAVYHMGHTPLTEEQIREMAEALNSAAKGDFAEADRRFAEWTKEHRAIGVVDELQQYIMEHTAELDAENIYRTALYLITESMHIECVKIGTELLELFSEPEEEVREAIRTIGLCDEFTIFSVWDMRKWTDSNEEIFRLAKAVRGWGRVHAVERLEPETDEIRRWLLCEGTDNNVMPAYSALICWEKAQAEQLLNGTPDAQEYHGISQVLAALLEEGPVPGISELNDPEAVLKRFLALSGNYDLTLADYENIAEIRTWAEGENHTCPDVMSACEAVIHSDRCRKTVREAVTEGRGLQLAEELDIPFHESLFACMKTDFWNQYANGRYLIDDPVYTDPVIDLFREHLPLSEMKGQPDPDAGLGEHFARYSALDNILYGLTNLPLRGTDLVSAGLTSRVIRNRNRALAVVKNWVKNAGKPLSELSEELYEAVRTLDKTEFGEEQQNLIRQLLEGETGFGDEN